MSFIYLSSFYRKNPVIRLADNHLVADNFLIKIFSFMSSAVFNLHPNHDILMKESLEDHKTIYSALRKKNWTQWRKFCNTTLSRNKIVLHFFVFLQHKSVYVTLF